MTLNSDIIPFHSLQLPVESLFANVLAVGVTGAGKTRTVLRPLIRSLLSLRASEPDAKCGALIIDPKGLDLLPIVQATLQACGRAQDLVLIGPDPGNQSFNPLDERLSPGRITAMILAAASVQGQDAASRTKVGERFWEAQDRALLTAIVAATRHLVAAEHPRDQLTFEHLQRFRSQLVQPDRELRAWATELVRQVGQSEVLPLAEWAGLPESTRGCVLGSLGGLLHPFSCHPLRAVIQPERGRPGFDLREIFEQGKIVLINTAFAESALELLPAQCLIKATFTRLALSRYRWARNRARPCWLIIDEGARCFTAHADSESSETNLMDMCRSNRVGVLWAAQNLSALLSLGNEHLVNKFAALCGTQIFLANTCPATANLAAHSLGPEAEALPEPPRENGLPPPLLMLPDQQPRVTEARSRPLVSLDRPRVPAAKLARLKAGEMWLRLAHTGEVHHLQADVSAD